MASVIHVVGAGLAGLSTAVQLSQAGAEVRLYEAANHAGGRCRSYFDKSLNQKIDNGNHLVLSGNKAVEKYLGLIDATNTLIAPEQAEYPFIDLRTGERWVVRPDRGKIPWSLLSGSRRVPGCSMVEYLKGINLAVAGADKTVWSCLDHQGPLYQRFWEPLAVSVLNTDPKEAAANLLWPVLRETFGRGEQACRPLIAKKGLSDSFVDPALSYLEKHSCNVMLGTRLKAIGLDGDRVRFLEFTDTRVDLEKGDRAVLAVPANVAHSLLPDLTVPNEFRAIVNAHFRLPPASSASTSFMGLVGGCGHWLFVRDDIASVTISAAEDLVEWSSEKVAQRLWPEVISALDLAQIPLGNYRIVKERRATFAQTPAQVKKRSGPKTQWKNLIVAGDWTDTGLPATIEGSLRSGEAAAKMILDGL